MMPGPMIAARVSSLPRHVRRGVRSSRRIVPNAPWMTPLSRSSIVFGLETEGESFSRARAQSWRFSPLVQPASFGSYARARLNSCPPVLWDQRLDHVVDRHRADQVAGAVGDRQ